MNIPPLISRTPPPINDVVDDEDEEEDDNDIAAFPSLDFCDPKISDKTSDEVQIVPNIGSDSNGRNLYSEESNEFHHSKKTDFPSNELYNTTELKESKEETEAIDNKIICNNHLNCIDTSSLDGKSGSSDQLYPVNNVCDDIVNGSIHFEKYQNEVISKTINDASESLYRDTNYTDKDGSSHNTDNDFFINNKDNSLDKPDIIRSGETYSYCTDSFGEIFSKLDENVVITVESDLNCSDTKSNSIDVRLVEDQEKLSPEDDNVDNYFKKDCYCSDECSCLELSDTTSSSEKNAQTSTPIVLPGDAKLEKIKSVSPLSLESTNLTNPNSVSSQVSSDYDRSCINDSVTKVINLPSVNFENGTVPVENLEIMSDTIRASFDETGFPQSGTLSLEFDASFPDFVQNYQLDQQNDDDEFSDFVVCSYEPTQIAESKAVDSYQDFLDTPDDDSISPVVLLCLKEELRKTSVWNKLSSLESTPALDYRWGESYSSSRLLSALKIDSRNILSGHWTKLSRKLKADDFKGSNEPTEAYSDITFTKVSVPHPQFEWVGSGLINPLDDITGGSTNLLDLQLLSFALGSSKPSYMASHGSNTRFKKSLTTLSNEAEKLISLFPDLSYLKQNFIVFPKNIN